MGRASNSAQMAAIPPAERPLAAVTLDRQFAEAPISIPDGFQPLVWERPGGSLRGIRHSTRLHLTPLRDGARPMQTLCGQRRPRGRIDLPSFAEGVCSRCMTVAGRMNTAAERAGVTIAQLTQAKWSCTLSGDRGLSDRDMVLQMLEHCEIACPDEERLAALTATCAALRIKSASDYEGIAAGLLAALADANPPAASAGA